MILILTECLKWSSFSQFVFYLVLFCVTSFKSLTDYYTGGTICIRVCYVYYTCVVIRYLRINKWVARVLVRNVGQFVSFDNLVPPFPIGVAAIFFLQSYYIGMLQSQSLEVIVLYHFVQCWWFNEKWINPDL